MSASYSNVKTVQDTDTLLAYLAKSLPTITAVSNEGNTNVISYFSSTLTTGQQTLLTSLINAYVDPIVGLVDEVSISSYNSTTSTLASSAVFTGSWEDVSRYGSITWSVLASSASATNGLQIQFGILAQQPDIIKPFSVSANTALSISTTVLGRYFRVVYTNGTTAQTSFSLQSKWSVFGATSATTDGTTVTNDTTQAQMVRAVVSGRQDNTNYTVARVDEERRLRIRRAVDNPMDASTPIAVAQLNFSNVVNADTTTATLVSGGTVTNATGTAVVAAAASAGSAATLTSRRYVTVGAGRVVRVFVSAAFATAAAGNNQLIGVGSSECGFFLGYNGTAFSISVRAASTDAFTAQSSFNVDPLNGTGPSGLTLVPTNGNSYMIVYDTSGFGSVSFALVSSATSESIVFHRVSLNTATTPLLRTYSFPLSATVINSTNTTALSMKVASMAAFVNAPPIRIGSLRATDFVKTISSITYVPVLSISNLSTFNSLPNTGSIILKSVSISADGTKGSLLISIFDNSTLANSAFSSVSAANSSAQIDTAATTLTGGNQIVSFPVYRSASKVFDLTPYEVYCSPGQILTIAARCSTASSNTAISASLMYVSDA